MCTFTLRYRFKERVRATTIAVAIVGRAINLKEAIQKRAIFQLASLTLDK